MDRIEVDGLQIAYERAGHGHPLVLAQGFVGDGPTTWKPQLAALAGDFTVVAWDAPGAGASSDPPQDIGIAGYADCLAAFIDKLGLHRPHVAGLSFGGILALELCRRHPGTAATLTLVSAYAGWRGSLPSDVVEERLRRCRALVDLSPEEFVGALLPTMFSETTPSAVVEEFGASMLTVHPAGFREMAEASAVDLSDALPGLDIPTLLLYGDKDVRAPLAVAEGLHAAITGSELVVLAGAGHLCNLEAPDQFNEALRAFLLDRSD